MQYLTPKEVAELAGVTYQAVYLAVTEGRIRTARTRPILITRREADRWMRVESGQRKSPPRSRD